MQVRGVWHDDKQFVVEVVAKVALACNAAEDGREALVDGIQGDGAAYPFMQVQIELRVTCQNEQQVVHRYTVDGYRKGVVSL